MLTIRREQMRVLEQDFQRRSILKHVRTSFPEACSGLNRRALAAWVDSAIAKAKSFGFTAHMDIQQFVDLVIVLGENFEDRPEFAWTREILRQTSDTKKAFRATWLTDRVIEHLKLEEAAHA